MTLLELPVPQPAADEVLIKVACSGICGSELSGYLGQNTLRVPPLVMGHEFSGQVAALSDRAAPARNVYPLPDHLPNERAALCEPLACAVRAVELAGATPADSLLITGLGPIGLLALVAAKNFGAQQVYATDTDPDRRALGEKLGAHVLDPKLVKAPLAEGRACFERLLAKPGPVAKILLDS